MSKFTELRNKLSVVTPRQRREEEQLTVLSPTLLTDEDTKTSGHQLTDTPRPVVSNASAISVQWPSMPADSDNADLISPIDTPSSEDSVTNPTAHDDHWSRAGSAMLSQWSPKPIAYQDQRPAEPVVRITTGSPKKPLRFFRSTEAQDAHDVWEQIIYKALWGGGPEAPPYKDVAIGYKGIHDLTRFSEKAIIRNIRSLIDKLSIEVITEFDRRTNRPTVYRVYSYGEINRRRKTVGLEWICKNRQGVTLTTGLGVNLETPSSGHLDHAFTSEPVASKEPKPLASDTSLLIVNRTVKESSTTALRQLLQAQLPSFDNVMVDRVWSGCRAQAPNVRPEQIAELFAALLPASRQPSIEMPNAWLSRAIITACTQAQVDAMTRAFEKAAATQTEPEPATSLEDDIRLKKALLAAWPTHQDAAEWRKTIELREGN